MAAYPSSPGYRVTRQVLTSRRYRVSEGGTVRGSSLAAVDAYRFTITHPWIDSTDMGTLQTWYDTNKDLDNTITVDSVAYDVNVEGDYVVERHNSTYRTAVIKLVGTKQ